MTFDPHRDDARRGVRRSLFLCGNATLDHDAHDPRGQSCGEATLQRGVTTPERWNMGPTVRDAGAAMDQRARMPSARCSPVISWRSVVHVGATDDPSNRAFHSRLAGHGMSLDLQRDNASHNAIRLWIHVRRRSGSRRPWSERTVLWRGDTAAGRDGARTLKHGTNAPRRPRRHGPTVEDFMAAQFTHDLHTDAVLRGNSFQQDPSGQDPSSTPTGWVIVFSPGLPSSPCIGRDRSGADQASAEDQAGLDPCAIPRGRRWISASPETATA